MQLLSDADREARIEFYANHGIGWVARPKHNAKPDALKGEVVERFKSIMIHDDKSMDKSGNTKNIKRTNTGMEVSLDFDTLERKDEVYLRMGRFKKMSNMNYALALSLRVEKCLARLIADRERKA